MPRNKKPFNRHKWILNSIRRLSIKYPPRLEVLAEGKTEYFIKSKHGKDMRRVKFTCMLCKKDGFKSSEIEMDHIQPIGIFIDYGTLLDRTLCAKENWQRLCHDCHLNKTSTIDMDIIKKQRKNNT